MIAPPNADHIEIGGIPHAMITHFSLRRRLLDTRMFLVAAPAASGSCRRRRANFFLWRQTEIPLDSGRQSRPMWASGW